MILQFPKIFLLYFALGLVLVGIVFTLVILNLFPSNEERGQLSPTPTTTQLPKPQQTSPIREQSVGPQEDISGETIKNPSQQVTFTLSEDVTPRNVRVTVAPPLPIKVQQGASPNEILVFPDPPDFWKPDVLYLVTIYDENDNVITSYYIKVPLYKVPYDPL